MFINHDIDYKILEICRQDFYFSQINSISFGNLFVSDWKIWFLIDFSFQPGVEQKKKKTRIEKVYEKENGFVTFFVATIIQRVNIFV